MFCLAEEPPNGAVQSGRSGGEIWPNLALFNRAASKRLMTGRETTGPDIMPIAKGAGARLAGVARAGHFTVGNYRCSYQLPLALIGCGPLLP